MQSNNVSVESKVILISLRATLIFGALLCLIGAGGSRSMGIGGSVTSLAVIPYFLIGFGILCCKDKKYLIAGLVLSLFFCFFVNFLCINAVFVHRSSTSWYYFFWAFKYGVILGGPFALLGLGVRIRSNIKKSQNSSLE